MAGIHESYDICTYVYLCIGSKQKGKTLFNNKKALDEILEFFHIQVTNPIVILSQVYHYITTMLLC